MGTIGESNLARVVLIRLLVLDKKKIQLSELLNTHLEYNGFQLIAKCGISAYTARVES